MSCQLGTIANIQDVPLIKKYLFPEQNQDEKKFAEPMDDDWNEEWSWEVEDEKGSNNDLESSTSKCSISWLQDICMSLSPTGGLMVFACGERIVYLAQKWNTRQEDAQAKYSVVHEGNPIHQPGETITSVLCLPLASQKRSLEGSPDWTCVVVGFSSGYVRIYTENGMLLINQIFCEEPVVHLKCTTYAPPRNNREGERAEEICILYSQSLVLIDGFSFYQALKACKNQAARAAATGNDIVDPPLLAYKKWGFTDQDASNDLVPCGYVQPTLFDQMVSDSISKGANSSIRSSLYGSHLYLNVGRGPCINFYHTVQTAVQPQLSDVTKAVANKLKTAFFSATSGWLNFGGGGTSSEVKDKKLKMEPEVPLTARFGLYDKRRIGEQVALSPDFKMAATTDSFGRVVLLDAIRGCAVRMWKGYRDAQVGWIESVETLVQDPSDGPSNSMNRNRRRRFRMDEDEGSRISEPRHTCFLVIYAPRRGLLEVWSAQSGPRVAAIGVSKTARLVYPGHGMLGLNNSITSKISNSEVARNRFEGLFFVDVDGSIKNLSVPFHLVFSGKNNKRTRDAHLLKQLLVLLKGSKMDSASLKADMMALYKDIKTCYSQRQFMEKVLSTRYLRSCTMKEIIEFAVRLSTKSKENNGPETKSLIRWLNFKSSLLDLYDRLSNLSGDVGHRESRCHVACEDSRESIVEVLTGQLKLEEHEASCLADALLRRLAINRSTLSSTANQKSVTFEEKVMTPEEFLCCFELRRKGGHSSSLDRPKRKKRTRSNKNDDESRPDYDDDIADYLHHRGDEVIGEKEAKDSIIIEDGDCYDGDDDDCSQFHDAQYEVSLVKNLSKSKANLLGEFLFELLNSGQTTRTTTATTVLEELRILLVEGPLLTEDLLNLLVGYILSLDVSSLKVVEPLLTLESLIISRIAIGRPGDSISDFLLDNYASLCSQSENVFSALILILIGRCLSCQATSDSSGELNPSWEEVTLTKEKWSQLTRQYQDLLVVDNLLKVQGSRSVVGQEGMKSVRISLEKIVQDGRGVIPETIGKCIGNLGIPVSVFFPPSPGGEADSHGSSSPLTPNNAPSKSSMLKECELEEGFLVEVSVGLDEVRRHLPLTASNNVMLANSCWEFVAGWNRDPEAVESLELALEYLKKIDDSTLQCGLAKMIWEMFLVKRLSLAVLLTDKVGKAPKDRLIRKEVGLSEKSLENFISFCLELLDVFLRDEDSTMDSEALPPAGSTEELTNDARLLFDVEDAWLDHSRGRNSSLLELATNQAPVESLQILHHRTLCIVMKAVMSFSLKPLKIFSLYDSKGRNAFFKPLSQSAISSIDVPDESVKAARLSFLERIITLSVCLLGEASTHSFQYDVTTLTRETGYGTWHKLITELTQLFVIDPDFTVVRFAYQLLLSGFDDIAIEVLLPVSNRNEAGKFLMPILVGRLHPVVFCPDAKLQARRCCISSTCLTNWIRNADPKIMRCTNVPLSWTVALSKLLMNLLNEDQPEFSLAKEAFDVIPNFE